MYPGVPRGARGRAGRRCAGQYADKGGTVHALSKLIITDFSLMCHCYCIIFAYSTVLLSWCSSLYLLHHCCCVGAILLLLLLLLAYVAAFAANVDGYISNGYCSYEEVKTRSLGECKSSPLPYD